MNVCFCQRLVAIAGTNLRPGADTAIGSDTFSRSFSISLTV